MRLVFSLLNIIYAGRRNNASNLLFSWNLDLHVLGRSCSAHIHAIYNDYGALVSLETGEAFRGKLPKKVAQLVKEWIELHREELYEDWRLAQAERELRHIEPLE